MNVTTRTHRGTAYVTVHTGLWTGVVAMMRRSPFTGDWVAWVGNPDKGFSDGKSTERKSVKAAATVALGRIGL